MSQENRIIELEKAQMQLYDALKESVKLQSHYAGLLNMWDGGQRLTFPTVESWLKRLQDLRVLCEHNPHAQQ